MPEYNYPHPAEQYLTVPGDESCYEYLCASHDRIKKDYNDWCALVNLNSKTMISQLLDDIEKLAAYLAYNGFKKGDVFSIFLPTSAHAFSAFYALNKLGIIASFIHPLTPPGQLKEMLELTKSKGIFVLDRASGNFADILRGTHTIVCSTSDYCNGVEKEYVRLDDEKNSNVPDGENIHLYRDIMAGSYPAAETVKHLGKETVIYLHGGGTTGKSKTIQHSSYALNNLAYKLYLYDYNHDYGDAYNICALPCFHAFGLGGAMHYAICNAFGAILMPKFDAVAANNYIKNYNVSEILGVPNMFYKMYAADNFVNPGLKNLKLIFSGGDILSEEFVQRFTATLRENGSPATLFRGWGLTEMCAICTTNCNAYYKEESVGIPLEGVEVKIVGANGEVLPAGETGELCLSGDTMMNGYLPDGVVTESGITYDENGKPWIHSGDMGMMDDEGFVFFTGRKKRIIIISGYNVYPYTMEQKIMEKEYVKEVCAVQGYLDGKSVIKLCLSLNETDMTEDEIKKDITAYCEENLDHFSVPRKIEFFDLLPRTKMEKLDFMAMSDPAPAKA
ncbi:MAG: AMP-binding protein [Clostridia bacterium]|nr:AMP-binding protein [Clostridia bacterium]